MIMGDLWLTTLFDLKILEAKLLILLHTAEATLSLACLAEELGW